jgi:hypothetical protein
MEMDKKLKEKEEIGNTEHQSSPNIQQYSFFESYCLKLTIV